MALQIIGSGFGRTGTMSMKVALEQLGFPCYHMIECFPQGPAHWKLWEEAMAGNPDWDALFEGFTATVDFPAATSFAALAEYFPEAKVVHTVRDPEAWYTSVQNTIFGPEWTEWNRSSEAGPFLTATINDYFDDRMHDHDWLIQRFHEHTEAVKAAVPADRLLVFEVAQGWGPLCEFLELPVPEGDFPRVNDTEAVQGVIKAIMQDGFQAVMGYEG
jgi:hypothetical protein